MIDVAAAFPRFAKLGSILSASIRAKIAAKAKGRPGPKHTPEMLAKFRSYSAETVKKLRELVAGGTLVLHAAKSLGITPSVAYRIINGECYKEVR